MDNKYEIEVEIMLRIKSLGWRNDSLFMANKRLIEIRTSYFWGGQQKNDKRIKIGWTMKNSNIYESWFFESIMDIMVKYKLTKNNFTFSDYKHN